MVEKECIFCKIANGEIPSATVYEDGDFRVILDLGPASRGHSLILPKQHYRDLCELDDAVAAKILPLAGRLGKAMMKTLGCAGFNVVQNNGEAAGQTVFHFHVHVIPRYENGPEMVAWKPGKMEQEELTKISGMLKSEMDA
ncbi:HIT family protein [Clostridium sp. M62/1]|uniref:HIT family protein n=1 Tax=unclassified Clostridium TaxID=2614128 RepID=UPI00019731DC|nr:MULTISPECIES: HIT family protein [unclassified Clostridium]EFE12810.1 histidine triad domain protein [Clostridium sp. M62/1]RHT58302.1 HIT family protein [Clostridium sp. AM29-11AC]UEB79269.1 HIT family protein [Clostridium sp. M62/1]